MNNLYKILSSLVLTVLMMVACSPDEYSLGPIDVKSEELVEGTAFKIEHDATNPNIVYLTSLMGSEYTPLWNHPQGRSQEHKVTLKIPFAGTYKVQFGVETRGGVVYGDTVTFEVKDMYAGFIEDEMWTMLAGGAGKSKTWYLDLDAEGVSRYFTGPIYFFSSWYTWDGLHTASGDNYLDADPWDWKKAILPTTKRVGDKASGAEVPGEAAWYWLSDWKGNSWICDAADFGTMTFDLKDNANITVNQASYGLGSGTGTYLLDVDNHMIKFNNVRPVHDSNRDRDDVDWYNVRILYISENAMQLGVVPNNGDNSMVVYNYISKDYYDNWTPGETEEPEPSLPDGWKDDISQSVQTSVKWVLSPETPFNWANLDGSLMNTAWVSPDTYDGWTGFDASVPATYANFSLTMDSNKNTVVYVDKDGNSQSGTYTLDEKGYYTFNGFTPNFVIGSWVNLNTSAENQWRITSIEKGAEGAITGMWVGVRDAAKPEYMVYHLVPSGTTGLSAVKAARVKK